MNLGVTNLDSLHFEISGYGMSRAVADLLSTIPPKKVALIGLDMRHGLIYNAVEREHLERLAEALKTRGFIKLRRIRVRLEFQFGGFPFEPTVWMLRGIFSEKLLSVEILPHERRYSVRSVMDDSYYRI